MVQMQALAAAQAQAQLQRQMLAQQQALLAAVPTVTPPAAALVAAAAAGGATVATGLAVDSTTARKSREVYIGNLSIGSVTPDMLTELFNAALAGMVPDPVNEPPVINVKMDNTGRFAFVELRTEELATTSMTLDKTELLGRPMNIGRPKGYVPGSSAPAANDTLAAAQQVAAALLGGVTNVVLLEHMLNAATIRSADERQEVSEMVYEESVRCGKVLGIAVPVPPPEVPDDESSRVYIKFSTSSEAAKCKEMMDGRMFDDNKVKCTHVTEIDYNRAAAGEWIRPGQLPPVPAAPVQPFSSIPGLAAAPGFAGLPVPGTGLIPGLPGQAPLSVPSLLSNTMPAMGGLQAMGGLPGAFPPPP